MPGAALLPSGVTTFGYLGIAPAVEKVPVGPMITAGINEKGLTCDMQTLITTKMPERLNASKVNLFIELFCQWALGGFADTDSLRAALTNSSRVHVYGSAVESGADGQHYSLRDAKGRSLVVEWVGGSQQVYQDLDDSGVTGWGIMTNEPEYPWMVRMVQHHEWKLSLARPVATMPGAFYPDSRFLRLHEIRKGLAPPKDHREAVMHAVHVLNTVTVPPGAQRGTDSGPGEGESDHTMWGVIYDHTNTTVYFREQTNQNLHRVRLADLDLTKGAAIVTMPVGPQNGLGWFNDAAQSFHRARH